jgi:hypothetical protein
MKKASMKESIKLLEERLNALEDKTFPLIINGDKVGTFRIADLLREPAPPPEPQKDYGFVSNSLKQHLDNERLTALWNKSSEEPVASGIADLLRDDPSRISKVREENAELADRIHRAVKALNNLRGVHRPILSDVIDILSNEKQPGTSGGNK